VSDNETFTRLLHFGTIVMGMSEEKFWHMPIGLFLDLMACHKQFLGIEKPVKAENIDTAIPLIIS